MAQEQVQLRVQDRRRHGAPFLKLGLSKDAKTSTTPFSESDDIVNYRDVTKH